MFIEIDNPGAGNCAFYSFVVALVDIIKHEHNKLGSSPTFDKWCSLSEAINFSRNDIYPQILAFDFGRLKNDKKLLSQDDRPSLNLLNNLQMSLRHIIYRGKCSSLLLAGRAAGEMPEESTDDEKKTPILNHDIYQQFAEIFYIDADVAMDNDLIKSTEIMSLVRKVNGTNFNQFEFTEKQLSDQKDSNIFHLFATDIFGQNYKTTGFTELNEKSSYILQSLQQVTDNKVRGTFKDMNLLASLFEVNLHLLENGRSSFTPIDVPGKPVITLDHVRQGHWLTRIVTSKSLVKDSLRQYQTYARDSLLTKKEIFQIFANYEPSYFDDHTTQVNDIINACNNYSTNVQAVMLLINDYRNACDENEGYAERVGYIRERYNHYNGVDEDNRYFTRLSHNDIRKVLQNYLNDGFSFTKNHADIAIEILNDCHNEAQIGCIMHKVERYITSGSARFEENCPFKAALDYFMENFRKESGTPPLLTKAYIRSLCQSYLNHSGSFFGKHHRIKALRTVEMCNDPDKTVNDICQSLDSYNGRLTENALSKDSFRPKYARNSTFKIDIDYILATYRRTHKAPDQDVNLENTAGQSNVI